MAVSMEQKISYSQKELGLILNKVDILKHNIDRCVQNILEKYIVVTNQPNWLMKAVQCIDLTTLSGDDTKTNVSKLCIKAANPLSKTTIDLLKTNLKIETKVQNAAICVYPTRVADAYDVIERLGLIDTINIASVATGFPSGLYPLHTRLEEIRYAVSKGANEIDVVMDRSLVLGGYWDELYDEISQMKKACGDAHLKVILGVGDIGTLNNVYKASMTAMFAGADFIKTSTGKETVNATLPVGYVMCRAINCYHKLSGRKVGLKPAGGVKTSCEAISWMILVHCELGEEWLTPKLFRIGASSLMDNIDKDLMRLASLTEQKS